VKPLVESLAAATTVPYRLVFVCSPDDEEEQAACVEAGHPPLIVSWLAGPADFAKKTNAGFNMTDEEFVFTGADDLDFRPAWDVAALDRIERDQAGVCGTNDGYNPMVKRGAHSTHSLVRRSYIEECGGTFDETPGDLLWTGYDHQAVDTELVAAAMARGCWTFAELSLVVHEHPFWNKAVPRDSTYDKALLKGREDIRLFQRRKRAFMLAQRRAVRA
jgi:hypothetical protein